MSNYNEDFAQWVAAAGPPPDDAHAAARSQQYLTLFHWWARDYSSDASATNFLLALISIADGLPLDEVWNLTGSEMATAPAPWSSHVQNTMSMRNADTDEEQVKNLLRREAAEYLDGLYPAFLEFVSAHRTIDVGAPQAQEITVDMIDMAYVTSINEVALKELDEGEATYFWQRGATILIGSREQHQLSYRIAIEKANGWGEEANGSQMTGVIDMLSRGGVTSRGKMEVRGCTDQEAFKAHVRAFSKKEIRFG